MALTVLLPKTAEALGKRNMKRLAAGPRRAIDATRAGTVQGRERGVFHVGPPV
jgi:hypothetical protein